MRGEGLTGTSNDGDLTKRIGIGRELRAGLDRGEIGRGAKDGGIAATPVVSIAL